MPEILIHYLASAFAILFVLVPHEFAHAAVAYVNGDPTPKLNGRLTLNPFKHFDPIGFVMCALVGFGWAKPVPINSANFKHYKTGLFTTAIAGVVANLVLAFLVYPLFILSLRLPYHANPGAMLLKEFLNCIVVYNLCIAYGQTILLILVAESFICRVAATMLPVFEMFDVLGYIMDFATGIIGLPIEKFWGLIL